MNFNKIALIILTLFILGCSSIDNFGNKIFSNPSDGITFYYEEIGGLEAIGGKTTKEARMLRYIEKAKSHCKVFNKIAIYEGSGATEQGLGTNKYKKYERYKCVKA